MKRLKLLWYEFQLRKIERRAAEKIHALGSPKGRLYEINSLLRILQDKHDQERVIENKIKALGL